MSWEVVLAALAKFWQDPRVRTILGLILLDVILAVAAAIKAKVFEWRRLAEFYRTMVVPYILGYLAFWLAGEFFLVGEWLGDWGDLLLGQTAQWLPWLALIGNLVADVHNRMKALGYREQ